MALVVRNADETFEVRDADLEIDDPDPDAVYTIRPLTRDVILRIEEEHASWKLNKVTHQRERVIDHVAATDAKLDYILVDWAGIIDATGKPLPCTRDAKIRAIGGRRQMALFQRADVNYSDKDAKARSFRGPTPVRGVVG